MSAQRVAKAAFRPRTRPSFAGAVRSELLKIRRQTLTWVLLAPLAVISAVTLGEVLAGSHSTLAALPLTFYFNYSTAAQALFDAVSGIFLLTATARLVGMEYASGTVRIVLARGTARLDLLGAQLLALALCGLLLLAAFLTVAAVALVSMGVCILLGTAGAAVGRSLPFAVSVALAFFPADNFATIVLYLLGRATHHYGFWYSQTQWLLGPSLNHLAAALQTDQRRMPLLPVPLVPVTGAHLWAVVGVWSALFAAAAVLLTWRRDVLE